MEPVVHVRDVDSEATHYHSRASDEHVTRNRLLTLAGGFILWWAGTLWADYSAQARQLRTQEIQIVELKKDVDAVRDEVENNATLSSQERQLMLLRIDRVDSKLDNLKDELSKWFTRPRNKETEPRQ